MKTILTLFALALVADLLGGVAVPPDTVQAIAFLPIALGAGAILSGISGAVQGHRANNLQKRALSLEEEDYRARSPARDAAMERLLGPMPTAPDLSAGFADPGNPFAAVNRQAAPTAPQPEPGAAPNMNPTQPGPTQAATIPPEVLERLLGGGGGGASSVRRAMMRGVR